MAGESQGWWKLAIKDAISILALKQPWTCNHALCGFDAWEQDKNVFFFFFFNFKAFVLFLKLEKVYYFHLCVFVFWWALWGPWTTCTEALVFFFLLGGAWESNQFSDLGKKYLCLLSYWIWFCLFFPPIIFYFILWFFMCLCKFMCTTCLEVSPEARVNKPAPLELNVSAGN